MYKVLSIDGGGIRALIPALILAEIEKQTRRPIASLFDLIVGTSSGGMLALGLTVPDSDGTPKYSAQTGIKLFEERGKEVFPQPSIPVWSEIRMKLLDEKYPYDSLVHVLNDYFEHTRLGDALTKVVITTYDLTARKPRFFKSDRAEDSGYRMWQIARATTAAPTFFEPHLLMSTTEKDVALIDGGVFANSPAMCAYAEALAGLPEGNHEIMLLSLGTGYGIEPYDYNDVRSWGQIQWALPLIKILMDSMGATVDFQLRQLMPERGDTRYYYRFQTQLQPGNDALDNVAADNLVVLRNAALAMITSARKDGTFDKLCDMLLQ